MRFEVTILGNGSASPTVGRHQSAHVLNVREQFFLIDCGEGTQERLMRAGISPLKIRAIFITHTHGDHLWGLPPLISSMAFMGRRAPLHIFGPAALGRMLDFFFGPGESFRMRSEKNLQVRSEESFRMCPEESFRMCPGEGLQVRSEENLRMCSGANPDVAPSTNPAPPPVRYEGAATVEAGMGVPPPGQKQGAGRGSAAVEAGMGVPPLVRNDGVGSAPNPATPPPVRYEGAATVEAVMGVPPPVFYGGGAQGFAGSIDFPIEFAAVPTSAGTPSPAPYAAQAAIFENASMEVFAVPLRHRVPTVGYVFREKQDAAGTRPRSYAYLSDTTASARAAATVRAITAAGRGVDLMYHEATYLDADKRLAARTGHSTARGAARVAAQAGAGRLIIGHFSARYRDLAPLEAEAREVFPETYLAEELRTFSVPAEKLTRGNDLL